MLTKTNKNGDAVNETAGFNAIDNRDFLRAEAIFGDILTAAPDNLQAAHGMILARRRQGFFADVIERCDAVLAKDPGDGFAIGEVIVALVRAGQFERALGYRDRIETAHNSAEAAMWLVSAMLTKGQAADARSLAQSYLGSEWDDRLFELQFLAAIAQSENWNSLHLHVEPYPELANDTSWVGFEFARSHPIDDVKRFERQSERSLSIDVAHYCPLGSGVSVVIPGRSPGSFNSPIVSRERVKRGISGFVEFLQEMANRGEFDQYRDFVGQMQREYHSRERSQLQVLSTGRCGTMALHHLLLKSKQAVSYHTCHWQMLSVDRNHVLYRILDNNFDDAAAVTRLVHRYLQMRVSELAYAARQDSSPVIINHWDTVMAPVNAVVYENSKFLHMHRNSIEVFESIFTKNQWQNEQLRYCVYDQEFPGGVFQCSHDDGASIEDQIAWYLHVTYEFGKAMQDIFTDVRVVELPSEDLFARKDSANQTIRGLTMIDDLSDEDFNEIYASKINEKPDRRQKASADLLEGARQRFEKAAASLTATGGLA